MWAYWLIKSPSSARSLARGHPGARPRGGGKFSPPRPSSLPPHVIDNIGREERILEGRVEGQGRNGRHRGDGVEEDNATDKQDNRRTLSE